MPKEKGRKPWKPSSSPGSLSVSSRGTMYLSSADRSVEASSPPPTAAAPAWGASAAAPPSTARSVKKSRSRIGEGSPDPRRLFDTTEIAIGSSSLRGQVGLLSPAAAGSAAKPPPSPGMPAVSAADETRDGGGRRPSRRNGKMSASSYKRMTHTRKHGRSGGMKDYERRIALRTIYKTAAQLAVNKEHARKIAEEKAAKKRALEHAMAHPRRSARLAAKKRGGRRGTRRVRK